MKRRSANRAGAIAALALGACSTMGPPSTGENVFSLTSSQFKDGTMLERKNAGSNPKALIDDTTSPDWMSCAGNDTCRRRD